MSTSNGQTTRKHYVICQHGLLGSSVDFMNLSDHLHERQPSVEVIVLSASSFPTKTLDGVEAGGVRCYNEIMQHLTSERIKPHSDISFIGHSLGGLLVRWALRLIEQTIPTLWQDHSLRLKYLVFVASPHCGIHASSRLIRISSQYLFKYIFKSVKDLLLETTALAELCDDAGIRSLNAFQKVVLYGNIARDHSVTATSALVLPAVISVQEHQDRSTMYITEYVMQHEESDNAADSMVLHLVSKFNSGVMNLARYVVDSPPRWPSLLGYLDGSAHARIICHGLLDRSKVGQPMLEHIESILLS